MGIINVWHTMMMMAEPHGVRSNLPRSYIHSTGIFYFIARPSFGLKDCVCAIIPTQRNFSVCFLSLPPDDHCLFLCFASMGGYLISEICCCRKLWSGLFWKAQEDFYYRQSQKISPLFFNFVLLLEHSLSTCMVTVVEFLGVSGEIQ